MIRLQRDLRWVSLVIVVGLSLFGTACSSDGNGNGGADAGDAGPSYPCLTECDPGSDAATCESYETCRNTGSTGYCAPPPEYIVPNDLVQSDYACLKACERNGDDCTTSEGCESLNDDVSACLPQALPCDSGEIAVVDQGCLTRCDPEDPQRCTLNETCRDLPTISGGACFPADAGM